MLQLIVDLLFGGVARDVESGAADDGFFDWAIKRLVLALMLLGGLTVLLIFLAW